VTPCCFCRADPHRPACAYFDSAHDPPTDGPFAEGADDDPDDPGRWRDAPDSAYPPAPDYGFPFDEYNLRPAPDGPDF
jgi:hypothetical protein